MNYFLGIINNLNKEIKRPFSFTLALLFSLLFFILATLHYLNIYSGSHLLWISWVVSIMLLVFSFIPKKIPKIKSPDKSFLLLLLFIFCVFWISHLLNFSIAPWNQFGLFDDAAWDIYFANNHAFKMPFQPAFFDTVGYISREVVFHYYISAFFKIFGYNLLIFIFSLLVLGFTTVLFTTLIIQKLFNNMVVTIISFIIINFFPLHFLHIFMGHRYAIAAPLMIISLYFLYTAFINKSYQRAIFSSLFAALCWGSAIMGKQYLAGLLISAILIWVVKRKSISEKDMSITLMWILGFLVTSAPMIVYVLFNYSQYSAREQGLLGEFILSLKNGGLMGLMPYLGELRELFFEPLSYRRQFLPDFYPIPLSYYALLLPGLIIAIYKKRFEIVLLSIIPVAGALLSGSYDFRILLGLPIWVIGMAFTINFLVRGIFKKHNLLRFFELLILFIIIMAGLAPSIDYLINVSRDTKHLYLLPHKDVAVSRFFQDIVVGDTLPSIDMKWNEFNRNVDMTKISYDTLISPSNAYAIAHVFLQKYDDKNILAFNNQGIQTLKTPEELLNNNTSAILAYEFTDKDLKLVWEVTDVSYMAINKFSKFKKYGIENTYTGYVEGEKFQIYTLTIYNQNIGRFQQDIAREQQSLITF